MTDPVVPTPSIGISYTVQLPNQKGLVMQSFVERDCDPKDLDQILDKLRVASFRQCAVEMVDQLERELLAQKKQASNHALRMAQVDENVRRNWTRTGRKGDPQLDSKERQEQEKSYTIARDIQERIAVVNDELEKFRALVR